MDINFFKIISAFTILFAVIDPLGSIPIVLGIQKKVTVNAWKVTLWSLGLMLCFFYFGRWVLDLFNVNEQAFAVAGSMILFLMALEMLLDVEIFKNNGPEGTGSIVPLAFPLFAGPAVFTTLLTLRTEYEDFYLICAIVLNMIFLFFILYFTKYIQKILGEAGIYITRKFFGIILTAIAVKVFAENLSVLFQ